MRLLLTLAFSALLFAACSGNVFALAVGECFLDPDPENEEVFSVDKVDCTEAHDFEVFAVFDLEDGDFLVDLELDEIVGLRCFLQFENYVGAGYLETSLDLTWIVPTSESWDAGERGVKCLLFDFGGGKLTESMKDSGA